MAMLYISLNQYKTYDAYCLVSLMQQLSQELEQDEARTFRSQVGSPIASSPPGKYLLIQFVFSWKKGNFNYEIKLTGNFSQVAGRNLAVLLNLIH